MKFKYLGAIAALALLTACSHNHAGPSTGDQSGAGGSANGMAGAPVPGSEQDLVANVGDRIFFETAQNSVSSEATSTLDRQASWLQRYPEVSVQVAGNCDERGTEEYNLALGSRRANADRDYLVAHGVSAARVTTISYGKDRPTALGSDEQSWSQNRNAITSVR